MPQGTCTAVDCGKPGRVRHLCWGHYHRLRKYGDANHPVRDQNRPLPERFWEKVDTSGDCWLWTGSTTRGYGMISVVGVPEGAHRVSYRLAGGVIPDAMTIDHLCRTRRCVRPDHLEVVTRQENSRRAGAVSHCRRGHEFTPDNTYVRRDGAGRQCRACRRIRRAAR